MTTETLDARRQRLQQTLQPLGQAHLLNFYDELDEEGKARLLGQIEQQDWQQLSELVESHVKQAPPIEKPDSIEPAPYYPAEPPEELDDKYAQAREQGRRLLREGKVAAFTVAGGQGTRLGWDGPKGTYPATPIHQKPLFQVFAEMIAAARRKYNAAIPWYIMTSPANDAETRRFFQEHDYFGLDPEDIMFFPQGIVPSFSLDGHALLEAPDRLAANPDGHGGSLRALHTAGAVDDMAQRGVQYISYFQVDNPLVHCLDPLFVGLHALDHADMSSKMVPKAHPGEKVGVFCLVDGRLQIIEYSDLPDDLAQQKRVDGSLRFNAGSIAIHMIDIEFVRQLNKGRFSLPYHRAVKKVPHVDAETGEPVEPEQPNAVKLEMFVFDALPLCESSIVLQTRREEEFAPIKNAEGSDSPYTSRELQTERAARWLESAGVEIPRKPDDTVNAVIELSPLTALEPEDLRHVHDLPDRVEPGTQIDL